MDRRLDFAHELVDGRTFVVPLVDRVSLVDLVAAYETRRGYDPAGGYSGLAASSFDLEPPEPPESSAGPRSVWLLGCDCGEAGCWPLAASVQLVGDTVVWSDFEQPHRPSWDYDGFGPFRFSLAQYVEAVRAAGRQ